MICPSKGEHRVEALAGTERSTELMQCGKKFGGEDAGT